MDAISIYRGNRRTNTPTDWTDYNKLHCSLACSVKILDPHRDPKSNQLLIVSHTFHRSTKFNQKSVTDTFWTHPINRKANKGKKHNLGRHLNLCRWPAGPAVEMASISLPQVACTRYSSCNSYYVNYRPFPVPAEDRRLSWPTVQAHTTLRHSFEGHFPGWPGTRKSPFSRWTWVSWYQNVSSLDFIGAKDDGGGEWWQLEL